MPNLYLVWVNQLLTITILTINILTIKLLTISITILTILTINICIYICNFYIWYLPKTKNFGCVGGET